MTAVVIPFPPARRRDFVARQARRVLEMKPSSGERHIELQIDCQRAAMLRKGVEPDLIDRELKCLEAAIRAELWRNVFEPGRGA